MAGLQQLKKRLRSIKTTQQIADAMKTVASAKFSKLSGKTKAYKSYTDALMQISVSCGSTALLDNITGDSNPLYIVLGANRGLCGAFNSELHSFAEKTLKAVPNAAVYVCGRAAVNYFTEKKLPYLKEFVFSDIPATEEWHPLCIEFNKEFDNGKFTSVNVIYSNFVNTMVQTPVVKQILPRKSQILEGAALDDSCIFEPDLPAVQNALSEKLSDSEFYACVLSSATAYQAAALMAMRTASDNAYEAEKTLETKINKMRQTAVTAGVIETSSSERQGEDVWKM